MDEHRTDAGDVALGGGIVLAVTLYVVAALGALYVLVRFVKWAWEG